MATHHGRPGGRLLELGLALGLAVLSVAGLAGAVILGLFIFGPVGSDGGGGRWIILGSLGLAIYILKHPWAALLKYYRYDTQTLRPIKEDETNDRDAH